jgi:hypothetical protein
MDSARQSRSRRGERVLPVRHQKAISTLHFVPVILVRGSTNETDLIVLVILSESWPTKPMGATFSKELLQGHICPSLRHGQSDWHARSMPGLLPLLDNIPEDNVA